MWLFWNVFKKKKKKKNYNTGFKDTKWNVYVIRNWNLNDIIQVNPK